MDNIKNDSYYIQKIRTDLEFITAHMHGIDIEELNENEVLLDSMMFRMIQISENAKKLSEGYKEGLCPCEYRKEPQAHPTKKKDYLQISEAYFLNSKACQTGNQQVPSPLRKWNQY